MYGCEELYVLEMMTRMRFPRWMLRVDDENVAGSFHGDLIRQELVAMLGIVQWTLLLESVAKSTALSLVIESF